MTWRLRFQIGGHADEYVFGKLAPVGLRIQHDDRGDQDGERRSAGKPNGQPAGCLD